MFFGSREKTRRKIKSSPPKNGRRKNDLHVVVGGDQIVKAKKESCLGL